MTGDHFETLLAVAAVLTPPRDGRLGPDNARLSMILGARYSGEPYQRGAEWELARRGWETTERKPCPCDCHERNYSDPDGGNSPCHVCGSPEHTRGTLPADPPPEKAGVYPTNYDRVINEIVWLGDHGLVDFEPVPDANLSPKQVHWREHAPRVSPVSTLKYELDLGLVHVVLVPLGRVMLLCGGVETDLPSLR